MIIGGAKGGYTIVEVIIFLAVSGMLFASAVTTISGRQAVVEFQQASRDAQSKVNDIINQVSSGFYPKTDNVICKATGGNPPTFSDGMGAVTQTQGSSDDCVFLGKSVQFYDNQASYDLITVAGRRYKSGTTESTSLADSKPEAIINPIDITEHLSFQNGLKVTCVGNVVMVGSNATCTTPSSGAVLFVGSFPTTSVTGNLASGSQRVSFGVVPGSSLTDDLTAAGLKIESTATAPAFTDPASGVIICFASSGGDQKARITFGGANHGGGGLTASLDLLNSGDTSCP